MGPRENRQSVSLLSTMHSAFLCNALCLSAELGFIPFILVVCQWNNTKDKAVSVLKMIYPRGVP